MSILHGSRGIVYFVHGKSQSSAFDSRALLRPENAEYLLTVTKINAELNALGSIIQLPPAPGTVELEDMIGGSPVEYTAKTSNGRIHIFSVGMSPQRTRKRFHTALLAEGSVAVIGENRALPIVNGTFSDEFDGYEAHLYQIDTTTASNPPPVGSRQ